MTLQETRTYVLAKAMDNIDFIKMSPANVGQAKQINSSLANIVAMERNVVMDKALERALANDKAINLQRLPEDRLGPAREEVQEPMSQVLGRDPAGLLEGEPGEVHSPEPGELREARKQTACRSLGEQGQEP